MFISPPVGSTEDLVYNFQVSECLGLPLSRLSMCVRFWVSKCLRIIVRMPENSLKLTHKPFFLGGGEDASFVLPTVA